MATRPHGRPAPRGKDGKPGGRVQPTPPWEARWRQASRASSDLCWQPEALAFMEPTTGVRPPHGDVFRALEAPVPLAECFADVDNTCPLTDACRLRIALTDAASAFYATLDPITLDALVCDNAPLMDILAPEQRCTLGMRPGNLAAQPQTS